MTICTPELQRQVLERAAQLADNYEFCSHYLGTWVDLEGATTGSSNNIIELLEAADNGRLQCCCLLGLVYVAAHQSGVPTEDLVRCTQIAPAERSKRGAFTPTLMIALVQPIADYLREVYWRHQSLEFEFGAEDVRAMSNLRVCSAWNDNADDDDRTLKRVLQESLAYIKEAESNDYPVSG